jgi:hypothetical protein
MEQMGELWRTGEHLCSEEEQCLFLGLLFERFEDLDGDACLERDLTGERVLERDLTGDRVRVKGSSRRA